VTTEETAAHRSRPSSVESRPSLKGPATPAAAEVLRS